LHDFQSWRQQATSIQDLTAGVLADYTGRRDFACVSKRRRPIAPSIAHGRRNYAPVSESRRPLAPSIARARRALAPVSENRRHGG
jgi:hypothetical protein